MEVRRGSVVVDELVLYAVSTLSCACFFVVYLRDCRWDVSVCGMFPNHIARDISDAAEDRCDGSSSATARQVQVMGLIENHFPHELIPHTHP
jgi:hypothetical protein